MDRKIASMIPSWLPLAAKICLVAIFLIDGIEFIIGFPQVVQYVGNYVPLAALVTLVIIAIKLLGSFSILANYQPRTGALALFVFTALTIVVVHHNLADQMQQIEALKNLAIMGGLLMIMNNPSGRPAAN